MNTLIVPVLSCLMAWCVLYSCIVRPAKKHLAEARAKADMTRCMVELNQRIFLPGTIQWGSCLHDSFYKFLFCATQQHDRLLRPELLGQLRHDSTAEQRRLTFRREIDKLDQDAKLVVDRAILSIARKMMTETPILFIVVLFRTHKLRLDYEKSMVESTEYITIATPCHC